MVLLASMLGAQQGKHVALKAAAPAASRWPVESLTIEGNRNYTAEQILAVVGLKRGQIAGQPEFDAARERLMATGAFTAVGYKFGPARGGKGYDVVFQVVEVAEVLPYRFESIDAPAMALEKALQGADPLFGSKIAATQRVMDRLARIIEDFLASKGIKQKISAQITADDPDHPVIVFSPFTPALSVAEVRFIDNKVISTTTLQNAIAGVAIGTAYLEPLFRQFLDASIKPLYEQRGYIRVSFPKIEIAPASDVRGVIVSVEVAEGERYQLGEVRFEGHELPVDQLVEAAGFKTGEVADFAQIQASLSKAETVLKHLGYLHPTSRMERKVNEQKKIVNLVIHLQQGSQYHFGVLKIEGLDLNAEAEIRRLWGLKQGAPFNAEYPDYFLARVREEGIFDNLHKAQAKVDIHDQTLTADVTLSFR